MARLAATALSLGVCAAQVPVVAFVDYSRPIAPITDLSFGINAFQGFNEQIAGSGGSAAYKANVCAMMGNGTRGIFRYHNENLMTAFSATNPNAWLQQGSNGAIGWNYTKIALALTDTCWQAAPSTGPRTSIMITLSAFPAAWGNTTASGVLNATYESAWVQLAADLVRFVNVNMSVGVKYWEVTNEWDMQYAAVGRTADLASICVRAAAAMRAVDGSILVGGPAWARPDVWENVSPFINATMGLLDFYSFHSYATGSTGTANGTIYGSAKDDWIPSQIAGIIGWYSNNTVPLFHDENNISWNPPDNRMTNIVGAIFDALFIASGISNGATSVMRWNEADGWYGACGNDANWTPRPPAYVWQLFNQLAWGNVTASAVAPPRAAVGTFSSFDPATSTYLLVLINFSEAPATVVVDASGWAGGVAPPASTPVTLYTVTNTGMTSTPSTLGSLLAPAGVQMLTDTVVFASF